MSAWSNPLCALLNSACQQTFGEPVVYQPESGDSFTVTGMVTRASEEYSSRTESICILFSRSLISPRLRFGEIAPRFRTSSTSSGERWWTRPVVTTSHYGKSDALCSDLQKKQIRLDRLNFPQTQMFKIGNVGVRGTTSSETVMQRFAEGAGFPASPQVAEDRRLIVALDLYEAYFTESSKNARFLTLIMALELLATGTRRTQLESLSKKL